MRKIEIYLSVNPADLSTAQQKGAMVRGGRIHFYEKKKVKESNRLLEDAILNSLADAPANYKPFAAGIPLACEVVFVYPLPSYASKRHPPFFKPTRPDVDNLTKSVFDQISKAGVWKDDSQVCETHLVKLYAPANQPPHIFISISELPQDCECAFAE